MSRNRSVEDSDIFADASPDPDDFWPDPPDPSQDLVRTLDENRVKRLGPPLLRLIQSLDRGLWGKAVGFALQEIGRGRPPDEIINSLLFGAFADFVPPGRTDPPRRKSDLRAAWVQRYVALIDEGVPEPKARQRLRDALERAQSRDPNIETHFAGLAPYTGENGKAPGRSTVDRWTQEYRRRRS